MNKLLLSAALAGMISAGAVTAQAAEPAGKEKCYGIAKAGENSCAAADGKHSCAGHSTRDMDANEWKFVEKGQCEKMNGKLSAPEKK